ncbi:MAG: Type 1 glutamine amidotransferase-like domain-containing protein [Actinomycetota bacterium]
MSGPLALVGGDELRPGNEPIDRLLVAAAAARGGPAFVLATAAARHRPHLAVRNAVAWFGALGIDVEELPVYSAEDARSPELAERASDASFVYVVGGDPDVVLEALRGSAVWDAIVGAWRGGAALAGSSAGAMAMASHVLLPGDRGGAAVAGLGRVPGGAGMPHRDPFGAGWEGNGIAGLPDGVALLGIGERTAVVFTEGGWRVVGVGAVEVLDGTGRARRHEAGGLVALPVPN